MRRNYLDFPDPPKSKKPGSYMFFLFLCACAVLIGFLFVKMEWPGSFFLIFGGCMGLILTTVIKYLSRKKVNWLTFAKMAGTVIISAGIAFTSFASREAIIVLVTGIAALLIILLKIVLEKSSDLE